MSSIGQLESSITSDCTLPPGLDEVDDEFEVEEDEVELEDEDEDGAWLLVEDDELLLGACEDVLSEEDEEELVVVVVDELVECVPDEIA